MIWLSVWKIVRDFVKLAVSEELTVCSWLVSCEVDRDAVGLCDEELDTVVTCEAATLCDCERVMLK